MERNSLSLALVIILLAFCSSICAGPDTQNSTYRFSQHRIALRSAERGEAFRQGLRDLGYSEGKNIIIDYRWGDGITDRLPDLAAELVRLKVDMIVTSGGNFPTRTNADRREKRPQFDEFSRVG